jgi:hypothetical protein
MDMGAAPRSDNIRPRLIVLGVLVVVVLVILYLAHIFYIQSLLVVWGAAIMYGMYLYDRKAHVQAGTKKGEAAPERLARLEQDLASVEEKLAGEVDPQEKPRLRRWESRLLQEVRRARWEAREGDMQVVEKVAGGEPLRELARQKGFWERRSQTRAERGHLNEVLDEAIGVLREERGDAARTRIALIAADLKANHGALKSFSGRESGAGDYADAWAVLSSFAQGIQIDEGVFGHAERKTKARLTKIAKLASQV